MKRFLPHKEKGRSAAFYFSSIEMKIIQNIGLQWDCDMLWKKDLSLLKN